MDFLTLLDPVTSHRFDVTIDGEHLGMFTGCQGLSASIEMVEYREGGQNGFTYRLPGRISFTPIVLTRAIETVTGSLAGWFTAWQGKGGGGKTGAITAYNGLMLQIAQWNLLDVYPSRWTGPTFGIDSTTAVTEQLEIVHHGFMTSGIGLPSVPGV
jgi:phage tail-like protein